ncbi:MAG: hypothetical protein H8E59_09475 [Actinobacteria bacterium]|nr:hypothetical protein [Actinomycetota bacterium]
MNTEELNPVDVDKTGSDRRWRPMFAALFGSAAVIGALALASITGAQQSDGPTVSAPVERVDVPTTVVDLDQAPEFAGSIEVPWDDDSIELPFDDAEWDLEWGAFKACMDEALVDVGIPDKDVELSEAEWVRIDEAFAAADAACEGLLPFGSISVISSELPGDWDDAIELPWGIDMSFDDAMEFEVCFSEALSVDVRFPDALDVELSDAEWLSIDEAFEAAEAECEGLLPFGPIELPWDDAEWDVEWDAFFACMDEAFIDTHAELSDAGWNGIEAGIDEAFEAAEAECEGRLVPVGPISIISSEMVID